MSEPYIQQATLTVAEQLTEVYQSAYQENADSGHSSGRDSISPCCPDLVGVRGEKRSLGPV